MSVLYPSVNTNLTASGSDISRIIEYIASIGRAFLYHNYKHMSTIVTCTYTVHVHDYMYTYTCTHTVHD